jgi:hypothetical protein
VLADRLLLSELFALPRSDLDVESDVLNQSVAEAAVDLLADKLRLNQVDLEFSADLLADVLALYNLLTESAKFRESLSLATLCDAAVDASNCSESYFDCETKIAADSESETDFAESSTALVDSDKLWNPASDVEALSEASVDTLFCATSESDADPLAEIDNERLRLALWLPETLAAKDAMLWLFDALWDAE